MRRRFFEKVFIIHYFWEHSETIFPNYRDGAKGRGMKFRVSHFRSSPVSTIRYQAAFLGRHSQTYYDHHLSEIVALLDYYIRASFAAVASNTRRRLAVLQAITHVGLTSILSTPAPSPADYRMSYAVVVGLGSLGSADGG